jgi:hypothetical protein
MCIDRYVVPVGPNKMRMSVILMVVGNLKYPVDLLSHQGDRSKGCGGEVGAASQPYAVRT